MLFTDTYKTISGLSGGVFRDKGSKFLAFAEPAKSTEEIKIILDRYKKEYHDARHHCYAYMLGYDKSVWRANDDGEPSGTAGKPILGQINSNDLTNLIIIVVRYFGGTLLGVSGLINAYRSASSDAISNSKIIECVVRDFYNLEFPYAVINDVMKIIKDESLVQSDQTFGLDCSINVGLRISAAENLLARFRSVPGLKMKFIVRQ